MPKFISRRSLLVSSLLVPAAIYSPQTLLTSSSQQEELESEIKVLPAKQVYQFIRTAHLNLEKTKELLKDEPRLIRAAWEWGPGDFELGIDGAAHTGSVDIVKYLVDSGAPYSVFAAATLGDLPTVKAIVKSHPSVAFSTGAHEIPLIEHAVAGGKTAETVVEFLSELGAKPREKPKDLPTTNEYRQSIIGEYRIEVDQQRLDFKIYEEGKELFVDAGHMGTKRLQFQGQDIFQLEGTPAKFSFEFDGTEAKSALLREGAPIGRAVRIK